MALRLTSLFLAFTIFAQSAWGSPRTCQAIFDYDANTIVQYAENQGLKKTRSLWDRYLWWKLQRIWNKPDQMLTQESFDKKIERSFTLIHKLKKRQDLLSDVELNLTYSDRQVVKWAEKALMQEGLKGFWDYPKSEKLPDRVYFKMTQIMQTKAMKALVTLYMVNLPYKSDKPIPDELLAKIIIDGIDPHINELKEAYNVFGQNKVTIYKNIQRVIKYIVIVVFMIIKIQALSVALEMQSNEQKAEHDKITQIESQLEQLEKDLQQLDSKP